MSKMIADAFFVVVVTCSLAARDVPTRVINWPQTRSPVIRITLGKVKKISSVGGQHPSLIDTTAASLWNKKISHLSFNFYLFDKNKVRIGDGWITLDNPHPLSSRQVPDHCPCEVSFISGAGSDVSRI